MTLIKRFVVKITVEKCDKIMVAVWQIFYRVKSVALWSAKIRKLAKDHKGYGFAARKTTTLKMTLFSNIFQKNGDLDYHIIELKIIFFH